MVINYELSDLVQRRLKHSKSGSAHCLSWRRSIFEGCDMHVGGGPESCYPGYTVCIGRPGSEC